MNTILWLIVLIAALAIVFIPRVGLLAIYKTYRAAIGLKYESSNASICSNDSHTKSIGLNAYTVFGMRAIVSISTFPTIPACEAVPQAVINIFRIR